MVLSLGLAAAQKLANSYIADLKPSINSDHTTWKISEVFPEDIKPLLRNDLHETGLSVPRDHAEEVKTWEGMYWWDDTRHQSGKFSALKFEDEPNPYFLGPVPRWEAEGRCPWIPSMEVYIELLLDQIAPENKDVFQFFWIDDGVGVEGGFKNDSPIPIRSYILLNNEYQGLVDHKLVEIEGDFQFRAHVEFDEDYVYPEFVEAKLMKPKIIHKGLDFQDKILKKRLRQLVAWVADDFNYDQSVGVE